MEEQQLTGAKMRLSVSDQIGDLSVETPPVRSASAKHEPIDRKWHSVTHWLTFFDLQITYISSVKSNQKGQSDVANGGVMTRSLMFPLTAETQGFSWCVHIITHGQNQAGR